MSRDGSVRQAAAALQRHATRHHRINTRHPRYAEVRSVTPLSAELADAAITLDEDEMNIGYAVQSARANGTLVAGDILLVQEMADGTWHAVDVAHDGSFPSGFPSQQQLADELARKMGASGAILLPGPATDLASAITLVNAIRDLLLSGGGP